MSFAGRFARWLLLLAGLLLAGVASAQPLQPVPPLSARVTDLTGTLDAAQRRDLDTRLAALEQRKGAQVVVLIVPTTQPEAIEQYSIRVAESWKIGRGAVDGKRVDDGVILLVAKNDRKVRIEVGYGLEGAIPDAIARRIIAEAITPRFRQGDFAGGLSDAVDDLARLIDGEALPAPWQPSQRNAPDGEDLGWVGIVLFVLVGGLIATAVLGRFLGSLAGGIGAGFAATTMLGLPLWVAVPIGFGVFVFLLVFAAAGLGAGRRVGRSGPVIMLPGGFGRGGGGFGGGGGGGGGFSGGGSGFGGGGASGGW